MVRNILNRIPWSVFSSSKPVRRPEVSCLSAAESPNERQFTTAATASTDLMSIQLQATDGDGRRVDSVRQGDEFLVKIIATANNDVLSAFADVYFDGDNAEVTLYDEDDVYRWGSVDKARGLIEELGAIWYGVESKLRGNRQLLRTLRTRATQPGTLTISTQASVAENADNVISGIRGDVRHRTTYGELSIEIKSCRQMTHPIRAISSPANSHNIVLVP